MVVAYLLLWLPNSLLIFLFLACTSGVQNYFQRLLGMAKTYTILVIEYSIIYFFCQYIVMVNIFQKLHMEFN